MKKSSTQTFVGKTLFALCTLGAFSYAGATENNHFPSVASPDLPSAVCNLKDYNVKLNQILSNADLSPLDMVKIHELTYTLETAVAQLQDSLKTASTELEEVHLASERLDTDTIDASGAKYMAVFDQLLSPQTCQQAD